MKKSRKLQQHCHQIRCHVSRANVTCLPPNSQSEPRAGAPLPPFHICATDGREDRSFYPVDRVFEKPWRGGFLLSGYYWLSTIYGGDASDLKDSLPK
ncbi:hypothetical protein J5N97_027977 [Dioscorea zingiberensis]|uniref:Uncharacterized protein n=1 Tax=Dioscorea zingiberensis TaxID=325984 RepID=A0A9D5BY77_9LILI|nr:hypothetical protein J5N97_027977 [Dioscorea zingiberensis]